MNFVVLQNHILIIWQLVNQVVQAVSRQSNVLDWSLNSAPKDVRELSWMSHGVMSFWFLLNFLFISAFFDILASLSISRVFSSGISGRWKFSGTFLSNYKYFSCKSSCLLLLLEVFKNHYRKENISVGGSEQRRDALFWINLRETWLE